MAKFMHLIPDFIKDKVEAVSKPKRRRMKGGIIASSNETIESKCKEIRWWEEQQRKNTKCVPVLFMFGEPKKKLTKHEVNEYKALGCRIEYMTQEDVKQLKLK